MKYFSAKPLIYWKCQIQQQHFRISIQFHTRTHTFYRSVVLTAKVMHGNTMCIVLRCAFGASKSFGFWVLPNAQLDNLTNRIDRKQLASDKAVMSKWIYAFTCLFSSSCLCDCTLLEVVFLYRKKNTHKQKQKNKCLNSNETSEIDGDLRNWCEFFRTWGWLSFVVQSNVGLCKKQAKD